MRLNKNLRALLQNHQGPRLPIVVLEGSSRSGKTFSICEYLVSLCAQDPKQRVTVVRRWASTCHATVVPTFQEVLEKTQPAGHGIIYLKSERAFLFPNGARIEFIGVDESQKLQGRRQTVAWLNEAMEIPHDAWTQLRIRTEQMMILDYNPSASQHWVFDELLSDRDDVLYVHSTFQDNPHLPEMVRAGILALEPTAVNKQRGTANKRDWLVYGLGQRGRREGVIYENWERCDPKAWPAREACIRHGYGLDFGYSQDPTALVECAIHNDIVYARPLIYQTGLLVARSSSMPSEPSVEGLLGEMGIDPRARIYCDSANPEAIRQLVLAGYNAIPTRKGPNSVVSGIGVVQGWLMRVPRNCQDLLTELENYCWKLDRITKHPTGEPEDEHNHALDAIRYWVMMEAANPRAFRAAKTPRSQGPPRFRTPLDHRRW